MKNLIVLLSVLGSFSAFSWSNSDFDRINETVENKVMEAAEDYLAGTDIEATSLTFMGQGIVKSTYSVSTSTDCKLIVTSGLAFKTKVESASNCQ
ncbi:MAG: hypothetical protein K9K67_11895 [Bacteriovoracaceae bacterium]|nr:hypothetical protein [Bacteriovoracaceae bacterium]